ncbi:hypothetical protein FCV25MIE_16349 [Fagus crenata]
MILKLEKETKAVTGEEERRRRSEEQYPYHCSRSHAALSISKDAGFQFPMILEHDTIAYIATRTTTARQALWLLDTVLVASNLEATLADSSKSIQCGSCFGTALAKILSYKWCRPYPSPSQTT